MSVGIGSGGVGGGGGGLCHEERDPKINFLFDNNSFVSQTAEVMVTYNIPVCVLVPL